MIFQSIDEDLGPLDYPMFHDRLENNVFIVREILKSDGTFNETMKELYDYMKQGFERKEVRTHPLKFRFKANKKEPIKTMQVRHFILQLMYWYPFMALDRVNDLNDSHIYKGVVFPTQKSSAEYINNKIIRAYRHIYDTATISAALDDMVHLISLINKDFAIIMATTLDTESFSDLRERYPEFKEITETVLPDGMQPKQIEDELVHRRDKLIDIIMGDDDNNIKPFIATGVGLNKGQFSQFAVNGGLKPDIEGNVIPEPINSSYIYGGLNSVSNFYIDGQAGCKPLILNKTVMGRSGHFAYKTMTLAAGYMISKTVDDCHSTRPIKFIVENEDYLSKIDMRYYLDDDNNLHRIDADKDTHLIGQTIKLRDPVTCCAHDGICPICYGDLYYTNNDPNFNPGRFAATQVNNPIQQKILSSKHMNATRSDMIEFKEAFDRFFVLETSKIKLDPDSKEDFADWNLMINDEDCFINDDLTQDVDFNMYTELFSLVNKKTNEVVTIQEASNRDIFFYGDISQMFKKKGDGYIGVNLGKIDYDNPIAMINIQNNELSTPLKNIIKLLDRVPHYGCSTSDEIINKFCQLTLEAGMDVMLVHCSMLVKGLVRRNDNILQEPDWKDEEHREDYQILTTTNALINHPSLTVSISFESMNKQIISPITYEKYKPSDYDTFYKADLYNDSRRYYNEQREYERILKMKKRYAKISRN